MKIKSLEHHRNGISGVGFYVAVAEEEEEGEKKREMLIIRFPKRKDKNADGVLCAVFDLGELDKREIRFGYNSWRGDRYAKFMDEEIKKHEIKEYGESDF